MSTRCTIKVIENKDDEQPMWIYHHCDGYPEGVGEQLKNYLKEKKRGLFYWDKCVIVNDIVKNGINYPDCIDIDKHFEVTEGQHGDEEYGYVINTEEKSLCYYELGRNEFDWSGLEPHEIVTD